MIYLVDKALADIAFRTAADDKTAQVVLIQDGVYVTPGEDVPSIEAPIFAIADDAAVRGIEPPSDVTLITHDDLVQLLNEHEIRSFV